MENLDLKTIIKNLEKTEVIAKVNNININVSKGYKTNNNQIIKVEVDLTLMKHWNTDFDIIKFELKNSFKLDLEKIENLTLKFAKELNEENKKKWKKD